MIKKQYILLSLLTFLVLKTEAQDGYFGKKTTISVHGSLRGMLIYNNWFKGFDYSNGTFNGKKQTPAVATGFGGSLSHYFSKRAGIGIDFNMGFNLVKTPTDFWTYYYDQYGYYNGSEVAIESMRMKSIYIVPKFEWSSRGNLPIGFSNSIGIGYVGLFIADDSYKISTKQYEDYTGQMVIQSSTLNGSNIAPIHGIVFEYGFKMRFPVTSFLTFDLGSNLRIHAPSIKQLTGNSNSMIIEDQIHRSMRRSRGSNIMDVRAGLSFILF